MDGCTKTMVTLGLYMEGGISGLHPKPPAESEEPADVVARNIFQERRQSKVAPGSIKFAQFFSIISDPIINLVSKVIRVLTGYSFWAKKLSEPEEFIALNQVFGDEPVVDIEQKVVEYTLEEKFAHFGMDLLRIVLIPFLVVAAIICFVYSLVDANEGRMLYVKACELFKGNAISRWNRDVTYLEFDESLKIDPQNLFPAPNVNDSDSES